MLMLLAGSLNQSIILFFSRPYFQAAIVIAEMSSNYYWYTGRKLVFGIKDCEKREVKWEPVFGCLSGAQMQQGSSQKQINKITVSEPG